MQSPERIHKRQASQSSPTRQKTFSMWVLRVVSRLRHLSDTMAKFQNIYRNYRQRKEKQRQRMSAVRIQCFVRRISARATLRRKVQLKMLERQIKNVIIVQAFLRMSHSRILYRSSRRAVIAIQSYLRMRLRKQVYKRQKRSVNVILRYTRGYLTRMQIHATYPPRLIQYRKQIIVLWSIAHCPLHYRSSFWLQTGTFSFLNFSLVCDELRRIYSFLDLSQSSLRLSASLSIHEQFDQVERSDVWRALKTFTLTEKSFTLKSCLDDVNKFQGLSSICRTRIKRHVQLEKEERDLVYLQLRGLNETEKARVYQKYGLAAKKRRKHTLAESVWTGCVDDNKVEKSAKIYEDIFEDKSTTDLIARAYDRVIVSPADAYRREKLKSARIGANKTSTEKN